MRRKNISNKKPIPVPFLLLAIYAAAVCFRFVFALETHPYPTTIIDEPLYISLARSIGTGKGLLFQGQPANLTNVLYPLVLSPVYAIFPEGTNFFLILQFWSICLMNLAVFPAYALFNALLKKQTPAVWLSVITIAMSDYILGGMLMGESIIHPLTLSLLYFLYQFSTQKELRYAILIALFGVLLFATKPGHIVIALSAFSVEIFYSCKSREYKHLIHTIVGILFMGLFFGAYYLILYSILGSSTHALGLYANQVSSGNGLNLGLFFKALMLYGYYFCIMCGGVFMLSPLFSFKSYTDSQKKLFIAVLLSIIATAIGTAWVINRVETSNFTIHTRYLAIYIPVFLAYLCLGNNHTHTCTKTNTHASTVCILGLFLAACSLLFGISAGVSSVHTAPTSIMGIFVFSSFTSSSSAFLFSCIVATLSLLSIVIYLKMHPSHIQQIGIASIILLALVNTYTYCVKYAHPLSSEYIEDTDTVLELIEDRPYIVIYGDNNEQYHLLIDAYTKKSNQYIHINNLYNPTKSANGYYTPFIPDPQRGILPAYETPAAPLIVIDKTALTHLILSEDVEILNPDAHVLYVLSIPLDKPWVRSIMGAPEGHKLSAGTTCYISFLDPDLRSNPVTLTLDMEFEKDAEVLIQIDDSVTSFQLPAGRDSYDLNISGGTDMIRITVPDCETKIYSYSVDL